jgi:hypothetical protein
MDDPRDCPSSPGGAILVGLNPIRGSFGVAAAVDTEVSRTSEAGAREPCQMHSVEDVSNGEDVRHQRLMTPIRRSQWQQR